MSGISKTGDMMQPNQASTSFADGRRIIRENVPRHNNTPPKKTNRHQCFKELTREDARFLIEEGYSVFIAFYRDEATIGAVRVHLDLPSLDEFKPYKEFQAADVLCAVIVMVDSKQQGKLADRLTYRLQFKKTPSENF